MCKQVGDAARLREAIGNTFERANLPDMSDEERERTLTFVVVGAGPTGVELTAELKDFIEQDCPRYYPHLLPYVRIKVLEASDRVLMQFEQNLQAVAVKDLEKPGARVPGLRPDYVQVHMHLLHLLPCLACSSPPCAAQAGRVRAGGFSASAHTCGCAPPVRRCCSNPRSRR